MHARARHTASRLYRRALGRVAGEMPPGSEDQNVATFDALQADAVAGAGWPGLLRVWVAEATALFRLRRAHRSAHTTPQGAAMTALRHDLRDAWRALRRSPSYTVVVASMLALGIGVNTAIFSVVDALLLKSLPYADADRLVRAAEWPRTGGNFTVAPAAFMSWRPAAAEFMQLEASRRQRVVLLDSGDPQTIAAATVTAGYFDLLGVGAALGRTFTAEDVAPEAGCRAVVSHALWATRMNGDSGAVGRAFRLTDDPCTLIGVLPANSVFDRLAAEIYVPLVFTPQQAASNGRNLTVLGKLAPDVTLEQARDRLAALAASFNATRGDAGDGWTSAITPWREVVVRRDTRQLVWILFGAVAVVLLIACANVAGLSLSRTIGRRQELAIRAALGAGRWRILRYLTIESLLLSALGGAAGLLVGVWTLQFFTRIMPPGLLPAEAAVGLDGRTLVFTAGISMLTGLLFGTLPAWQASRSVATSSVTGDNRTQSASRSTSRLHAGLVIAEMALAMVLITGAALLVTSFVRLGQVDPGFDPSRVLTMTLAPPDSRYPTGRERAAFLARVMSQIRALPGVEHAAAVTSLPLGGWLYGTRFIVEGRPDDPERPTSAHIQHATDGYFETLQLQMAAGRTFTAADGTDDPLVAVVNETFAARYLNLEGRPAVGRRLDLGIGAIGWPTGTLWEIVGVVRDVKTGGLDEAALTTPEIYVPQAQSPVAPVFVAARARGGDPMALGPSIRDAVRSLDADLPIDDPWTMTDRIGGSVRLERFRTSMISALAVLACLLAGFGIFSVRSRAVSARRREMGIRLALGATRGDVLGLVLRQGVWLASTGVLVGLVGSIYAARVVERWLFRTEATDPVIVIASIAIVMVPALLASWLPARRAARVDPCEALRP